MSSLGSCWHSCSNFFQVRSPSMSLCKAFYQIIHRCVQAAPKVDKALSPTDNGQFLFEGLRLSNQITTQNSGGRTNQKVGGGLIPGSSRLYVIVSLCKALECTLAPWCVHLVYECVWMGSFQVLAVWMRVWKEGRDEQCKVLLSGTTWVQVHLLYLPTLRQYHFQHWMLAFELNFVTSNSLKLAEVGCESESQVSI